MVTLWAGILATAPTPVTAQGTELPDTIQEAGGRSAFLVPMGSLVLPGLGQYLQGAPGTGAAFSSAALTGYVIYGKNGGAAVTAYLPRDSDDQLATSGILLTGLSSYVSAYDAFRRAVPRLQREGKYAFLPPDRETGKLFTAPFDPSFLGRWTTWVDLAYTGTIVGIVLSDREAGVSYEPLRARDVGFGTMLSLSAGIGEEAAFRGWLFPMFHQLFGERFWLSSGLQAALFGAGHVGSQRRFAAVTGAWAFYEGWLTRRNDWSVRESVFHHFWYDLAVVTATFLTDTSSPVQVVFPTMRF